MFKKPFSSEGRIRRMEYGISYIFYILMAIMINIIIELLEKDSSNQIATFMALSIYIPLLWFFFAQGAKRCHDLGNSGWYQIIPFYFLWMVFSDGQKGRNEYGENPKTGKDNTTTENAPLDYNPDIR